MVHDQLLSSGTLVRSRDHYWDGLGRYTKTVDSNGSHTEYFYTPGGSVARVISPGAVMSSDDVLHVGDYETLNMTTGVLTDRIFADGHTLAEIRNGTQLVSIHRTFLESVAAVSDTSNVLRQEDYTPFGGTLAASGSDSFQEHFDGLQTDHVLLAGGRAYDSAAGTWLGRDRAALSDPKMIFAVPQNAALYGFNSNNPLAFRDPQGTSPLGWIRSRLHGAGQFVAGAAGLGAVALACGTGLACGVVEGLIGTGSIDLLATGAGNMVRGEDEPTQFGQALGQKAQFIEEMLVGGGTGTLGIHVARRALSTIAAGEVAAESPNVLTLAESGSRLTADEIATGQRLARQLGKDLSESSHVGEEYVDELGRAYDALGKPAASKYWNQGEFINSINEHLLKQDTFTALDLTGFTDAQKATVRAYIDSLPADSQEKIIRIGF